MTRDVLLAFEDIIHGTGNVYSSAFAELRLSDSEAYAIQCVVEGIQDVESTTVQLETSGDGRNWVNKNPTPEIDAASTPPGSVTSVLGFDVGNFPGLALLRLRITLGIMSTSTARVRVFVRQTPGNYVLPSRLPGCKLWLRSDLGITFGAGGTVSNWADQSKNGNDVAQATGANRPTWTANQVNGLPTIDFDGSNDVLTAAAFALGPYTIMMVTTGQDGTDGWFWTRADAGSVVSDTLYGTTSSTMYSTRAGSTSAWDLTGSWGQWGPDTARILIVTMDGTHAGHKIRMNAVEQTPSMGAGVDPGTSTTTDQFSIGARNDSVLPSRIKVAEVAVFNHSLPTPQLTALEEYARRRYKLY